MSSASSLGFVVLSGSWQACPIFPPPAFAHSSSGVSVTSFHILSGRVWQCADVFVISSGLVYNSRCAVQVMQQAGAYVKEEVCRALIVLISNAPELHGYTARSMYRALKTSIDDADLNLSLVTSTCWFLGLPVLTLP